VELIRKDPNPFWAGRWSDHGMLKLSVYGRSAENDTG